MNLKEQLIKDKYPINIVRLFAVLFRERIIKHCLSSRGELCATCLFGSRNLNLTYGRKLACRVLYAFKFNSFGPESGWSKEFLNKFDLLVEFDEKEK